jgi:acyl-CoA synthetase (AMP-forming)/AMP-acid ligase II
MGNIATYLYNRIRSQPDAPAVTFRDRCFTFGQFGDRVGRIAGAMRGSLDLSEGDRVVLWMENRIEFLEVLFACWVGGLCAVPANAKLHPRELAHIVGDSGAKLVFTSDALEPGLMQELGGFERPPKVMVVGSTPYDRLADAPAMSSVAVAPTDIAWIFYTSGTTGKPKGAMLSHRNLAHMSLVYYADIERVELGDTKVHAAPLSHASGLYSLPHLLGGGHQVILPVFEPDGILDAFERYSRVTMFAAPTMVTRLLQAAGTGAGPTGLRTLYYGGGPMYVSDLIDALDVFGPRLYQIYGQGESPMTIAGLSKRDHVGDRSEAHLARLRSCGTPRTGVEVRVVDEEGRDAKPGHLGEVITRSDCVMRGYWNNAEATSHALRNGWLRTGDIGFIDERGYLTLRDRSKDMIISGGSNIYPREIEEVLLQHPGVLECSVVGRPHPEWGEEVVAFVVARPGESVREDELDALCLENIARFKRPRMYRFVEALPKNAYGKVLKTTLREYLAQEISHG